MFLNIKDYHSKLSSKAINVEQTVKKYLARIEEKKKNNIFINVFKDSALATAVQLDKEIESGAELKPLHGVIVAIKDVICYKNHPTTAASKVLENFISVYNATAIEKLINAGAIIIGSTNCDEFAMGSTNENSYFGKTLNDIDLNSVPGGSSGGSAVAMQTDCCMISLGSDTGGSVRQPADFCGVIGIKPTYGRISRYGLIAYASSFDQIGIFGKNLDDVAKVLEIISGPDEFDATAIQEVFKLSKTELSPSLKIGYFNNTLKTEVMDNEISNTIENTIQKISEKFTTIPLNLDYLDYIVPTYYILTTAEASSNLGRYDGVRYGYRTQQKVDSIDEMISKSRSESFGYEVQKRILLGSFVLSAGYFDAYFTKAQKVRTMLIKKCEEYFKEVDFIVFPNSPSTAFEFGKGLKDPLSIYMADIFTVYANLVGIPSISLPLYKHSNGKPYGIQVIAPHLKENELLNFSNFLMEHKQ